MNAQASPKLRKSDENSLRNRVLVLVMGGAILAVFGFATKFVYEANTVYAQKTELKEVEKASAKKEDVAQILVAIKGLVIEQKALSKSVTLSIKQTALNAAELKTQEKNLDRHISDDERWQDSLEKDVDRIRDKLP